MLRGGHCAPSPESNRARRRTDLFRAGFRPGRLDRAYRKYLEEHHKKYHEFSKAKRKEQEDYWDWRHSHPEYDHR
jgi:hypothetical protein